MNGYRNNEKKVGKKSSRNKLKWGKFHPKITTTTTQQHQPIQLGCLYLVFMSREWYPLSH